MRGRSTMNRDHLTPRMYTIDDKTDSKLRRMARRNDMSMSQVIRHVIAKSNIILDIKKKERY